jgi:hypothetical protein
MLAAMLGVQDDRRTVFAVKRPDRKPVLLQKTVRIGNRPHGRAADNEIGSDAFLPGGVAFGETGVAIAGGRQSERERGVESGGATREALNL